MENEPTHAPHAETNPYRLHDMKTTEEWLELARWYPFSIRCLIFDGRWYECGRCSSRDDAYHIMKALSTARHSALNIYVVVQCLRLGKEGREKVVLFSPGKRAVDEAIAASKESQLSR